MRTIFTEQYIILTDGQICTLRLLKGEEDSGRSLALQDEILSTIEDTAFISQKTQESFLKASDGIHAETVGAFVDGKLIGQMSLSFRTERHHVPMDRKIQLTGQVALIAGAKVHPEFRGNKIAETMYKVLEAIAKENGTYFLIVETNASNSRSYSIFMKHGFFVGNSVIDPSDGTLSFILFKSLKQKTVFSYYKRNVVYDGNNKARLLTLIAQGCYGTSCTYDRATNITTLHFRKFNGFCERGQAPSSLPRLITH